MAPRLRFSRPHLAHGGDGALALFSTRHLQGSRRDLRQIVTGFCQLGHHLTLAAIATPPQPDHHALEQRRLPLGLNLLGSGQFCLHDALLGKHFKAADVPAFLRCDQRNRHAALTGATGAPDAVHVRLGVLRRVVVEHMRNAIDIQAARGNVGGHQHVDLMPAEPVQHVLTGALAQMATEGFGRKAAQRQLIG